MTTKDPVVQDLAEWINRSAGQHQRRISEGAESAARLLRLPVRQMTNDPYLLHRTHQVDTHDLEDDDGCSVGGCCIDELPIEYSGDEPSGVDWIAVAAVCIVLAAILVASFSAEIAEVLYRMDVK